MTGDRPIGLNVSVQGIAENIARVRRIDTLVKDGGVRALSKANLQGGSILRGLLMQPKRVDPFWGVMGSASGIGLAARTGETRAAVIARGEVFIDSASTLWSFVGNAKPHVAQLEDGGTVAGDPFNRIPTAAAQTSSGADRWPHGDPPGSFRWPTPRMKNFKNGRPKYQWIVMNAKKGGSQRQKGKGRGIAPMPNTPRTLVFLYMLKPTVTKRAHRTFATLRQQLQPTMDAMCRGAMAEVVRVA